MELKALKLVSRLQQPLEFSAHLEAEIRARACRVPPILLANTTTNNSCNNNGLAPTTTQPERVVASRSRQQQQQQQLLICPSSVAAVQNLVSQTSDGEELTFALDHRRSSTSVVILGSEGDFDRSAGAVQPPATTTFRLYYQFAGKAEQREEEVKSEEVKTEMRPS